MIVSNCVTCHNSFRHRNKNAYYCKQKCAPGYQSRKRKDESLKHLYNISIEDYDKLQIKQDFKCAICKTSVKLSVDHCHKTGLVRGLLCHQCNFGLGAFKDNLESLKQASIYLEKSYVPF